MLIDLHSHSTLSDGTLSIEEMVAAAERRGYEAFAITDHARGNDPAYPDVIGEVREQIDRLRTQTQVRLFAGVELTDFEPELIPRVAEESRRCGAQVVVVHGECLSLSVAPGTNAAAVRCSAVDILAHPGLISEQDADEAARFGVYLELSARQGANWANGHVYKMARIAGAPLIVDSDAHDEAGLLSVPKAEALVRGAGASELSLYQVRNQMAAAMFNRLTRRYAAVG
ncbi:MAG TPA: histidinol phosphate phosphatase domain-containing protein [Chloroflexota bacterium]|nr:histidinol phosphate phosphatase domain-containing protein [Chloroflexota bacterium]